MLTLFINCYLFHPLGMLAIGERVCLFYVLLFLQNLMWILNTFCCVSGFNEWFGSGFINFADELDVAVK